MIERTSLLFIIVLTTMVLSAQEADREFDEDAMAEYAESRDFAYMNLHPKPVSIWERLQDWFARLWKALWYGTRTSTWIGIIVMAIGLGIAIFWLTRIRYKSALVTASDSESVVFKNIVDDSIDYSEHIIEALEDRDYKLAIRYLYLKSLVSLAKGGLIQFDEWKTPYDYQSELPDSAVDPYGKLALLFEYSWYGDFDVKRADFEKGNNYAQMLEEETE